MAAYTATAKVAGKLYRLLRKIGGVCQKTGTGCAGGDIYEFEKISGTNGSGA